VDIDWDRTPAGHNGEPELCVGSVDSVSSFFGSISDSKVQQTFGGYDNLLLLVQVVQPIILTAWDAATKNSSVTVSIENTPAETLRKLGVNWGFVAGVCSALAATDCIEITQVFEADGTEQSFTFVLAESLRERVYGRKPNSLDYARALDVHTWSEHPQVNQFVDKIYETHFSGGNTRIRKKHLKVLLLDLYLAWCDDPKLKLTVHRNVNDYKPGSRYNSLHISKLTPLVVDQLEEAGLVHTKLGFLDRREGGHSRISRVWPTKELMNMFAEARFGPVAIHHHEDRECIVLRDIDEQLGKNIDVEYEDTDATRRMRAQLQAYNSLLADTFIDIPTLATNFIDLDDNSTSGARLFINQNDKFVRRIFNRGSWEKGGRFWGGWWQRCPKDWRATIFLNDHPISELDYSGLHIVTLYAQEGISYWDEIGSDPYEIDRPPFINDNDQLRSIAKLLMLVALNARDETSAFSAFRSEAEIGSYEKTLKNDQLKQMLDKLREKHERIADKFASDAGIDLMNTDSQITEKIIQHFTDHEVPILTIHDSYLVPFGMEKELEEQMVKAFHKVTGIENVKLKEETHNPLAWEPHSLEDAEVVSPSVWEQMIEYRTNPPRTDRYKNHYQQFQEWLARGTETRTNRQE
jgi:hypothetical protein